LARNAGVDEMLEAYSLSDTGLEPMAVGEAGGIPASVLWVDLFEPTRSEETATEAFLGTDLPTREESQEIEFSSRFYVEEAAVFMTASLLTGVERGAPVISPLTIAVGRDRVVTLRYEKFRALRQFVSQAGKPGSRCESVETMFNLMIEAIVDRAADVIEQIGANVDRLNSEIFHRDRAGKRQRPLEAVIGDIGIQENLAAKIRESLHSLERLVRFAGVALPSSFDKGPNRGRLKLAGRDIQSLEAHITFLSSKIAFLLDATLGLISVEQNEVIRLLTIVATIFFPPTLIGTIYGMNFEHMPELQWTWSYPLSLGVMIASALVPYLYFKMRGWL
jgi:magnesium transporter